MSQTKEPTPGSVTNPSAEFLREEFLVQKLGMSTAQSRHEARGHNTRCLDLRFSPPFPTEGKHRTLVPAPSFLYLPINVI